MGEPIPRESRPALPPGVLDPIRHRTEPARHGRDENLAGGWCRAWSKSDRPRTVRAVTGNQRSGWELVALAGPWLLVRALLYGSPLEDVLLFGGFLGLFVFLPGWLMWWRLAERPGDGLLALAMAGALGLALLSVTFAGLRLAGAMAALPLYPLGCALLFARGIDWSALRRPRGSLARAELWTALILLVLVLCAIESVPLVEASQWFREVRGDALFHAGNAAEVANHWPLRDPRVFGLPLNYHFFAYTLPAAAERVVGVPVAEVMLRSGPALTPALVVLTVFAATRLLAGERGPALLAAALLVAHADAGAAASSWFGADWALHDFFAIGFYESPSTVTGFLFYATLFVLILLGTRGARPSGRLVGLLALVACAASGSKGSVMPVVLGGLAGAGLVLALTRRRVMRVAQAFVLCALAAAPMTLMLVTGEASYAKAMFRPEFAIAFVGSDFYLSLAPLFGEPAARFVLLLPWLVGFFGLGALGTAFALVRRRLPSLTVPELWIVGSTACGALLALTLSAPGLSELFFAYNGMVGLTVLAGIGLCRLPSLPPRWRTLGTAAAVVFAGATLFGSGQRLTRNIRADLALGRPEPELLREYRAGLEWLREHTPREAVVVTSHERMVMSVWAERRSFFETELYTPAAHARIGVSQADPEGSRDPIAELRTLRDAFFARPAPATWRPLAARLASSPACYVVVSDLHVVRTDGGRFGLAPLGPESALPSELEPRLEPVFENRAVRIYRVGSGG